MKNLFSRNAVIAFLVLVIVSSCTDHTIQQSEELHDHVSLIPESEEVLNPTDISLNGYSVGKNILLFETEKAFKNLISSLQEQSEESLDQWEKNIGFHSLRMLNNETHSNPDIDDAEYDLQRLPDFTIETVLNSNAEVSIAGKVHRVNIETGKRSEEIDAFQTPTEECRFQRRFTNELEWGGILQRGEKWNTGDWLYKSIGTSTTVYRRNKKGKWKRNKEEEVHLLLDQWNEMESCKIDQQGLFGYFDCIRFVDESKIDTNASKVKKVFRWLSATNNLFCVPEFGRVHHWANNQFWNDCHTEAADW